jgi:menaquinone-dependent protoporphyrinogen IX oxidase
MSLQEEEEESLHSEAFEEEETNEASQPAPSDRPTINVSASRRPTHYHSLAKQYLQNNQRVLFVAMEAAILVSIDAALLLERNQIARIERYVSLFLRFFVYISCSSVFALRLTYFNANSRLDIVTV